MKRQRHWLLLNVINFKVEFRGLLTVTKITIHNHHHRHSWRRMSTVGHGPQVA